MDESPQAMTAASIQTYRDALFEAMEQALIRHDHTVIIGQGVTDHKGIFGTTIGLGERFGPRRVIETPLMEEGSLGICLGAALNGLYPINTHIRADFAFLAMNQMINLAAKYRYMFGGLFEVPMLVRLVIGRSWGQGAQHSQSPQSMFAHTPGLVVVMPSTPEAIRETYAYAIAHHRGPVISLEHRLMYELAFRSDPAPQSPSASQSGTPPFTSRLERRGRDVTIVATSIMVLEAKRAAERLAPHDIECEIIDLHCPSHPDRDLILDSVARTGKLLIADTSWLAYGVAAEVCRIVAGTAPHVLTAPVAMLGMQPAPCPTAKSLEDMFYPNLRDLMQAIVRLVTGGDNPAIDLPDERSMADFYKTFRGPF